MGVSKVVYEKIKEAQTIPLLHELHNATFISKTLISILAPTRELAVKWVNLLMGYLFIHLLIYLGIALGRRPTMS